MDKNKEESALFFEEMIDWIKSKTDYNKATIQCILDLETE